MWGGIYAVLFSISTVLSYENPIKNGFSESITTSYIKHSLSAVEFQNKVVGQEVQYSKYESKKFGPQQYLEKDLFTLYMEVFMGPSNIHRSIIDTRICLHYCRSLR